MKNPIMLLLLSVHLLCFASCEKTEGSTPAKSIEPKPTEEIYRVAFFKDEEVFVEGNSFIGSWFDIETKQVVGQPEKWEEFLYVWPMRPKGKLAVGDEVEISQKKYSVFVSAKALK